MASSDEITSEPSVDQFRRRRSFPIHLPTWPFQFHVNAGASNSGDDSVQALPMENGGSSVTCLYRSPVNAGASNSDNDSVNTFPMQNASFSVEPVGLNDPFWQLRSFTSPFRTLFSRFHVNAGAAPSSGDDSVHVLPRHNRSSSATWLSRFFVNAGASNSDNDSISVNTFPMQNTSFSVEPVGFNDPSWQLRSFTSPLGTLLTRFHVNAGAPSSGDDSVHVLPMHNRSSSATWLSRFFVNAGASNSGSVNTFQMQNASFSVESVGVNDPFMQLRSIAGHLGTFLTRFHLHVNAWVPSSDDDSVHVLPMHNRVSDVEYDDPFQRRRPLASQLRTWFSRFAVIGDAHEDVEMGGMRSSDRFHDSQGLAIPVDEVLVVVAQGAFSLVTFKNNGSPLVKDALFYPLVCVYVVGFGSALTGKILRNSTMAVIAWGSTGLGFLMTMGLLVI